MNRNCTCGQSVEIFGGQKWPQPDRTRFRVSQPEIRQEDIDAVASTLSDGWVGPEAPQVRAFEDALHVLVGQPCLAVSNGSVALVLALTALGVRARDQVIVPALTYAASASSVIHVGAEPVFVDVDEKTWSLDLEKVRAAIGPRTKAVIAVNLYGVSPDLPALRELCDSLDLYLIEDSAENFSGQAFGSSAGTWGHIGTYSFFANKSVALGEAGAVTTGSADLLEVMKSLRGQGMSTEVRYYFDRPGFNFRLPAMTAALGVSVLSRFSTSIEKRRLVEETYALELGDRFVRPTPLAGTERAPWIFTATIAKGSPVELAKHLGESGIETRPVFVPMGLMSAFDDQQCKGCQVSTSIHMRGISLPTYNALELADVKEIASKVRNWFDQN
jgi:perosamine synthetase